MLERAEVARREEGQEMEVGEEVDVGLVGKETMAGVGMKAVGEGAVEVVAEKN